MREIMDQGQSVFLDTYKQLPIVLEKGIGNYVYDTNGKKYLDFVAGIATNALGYSFQPLKDAIKEQVDKMTHCSNLYYNTPSVEAAKLLVELSGLDKVFFCNSGAEANEAAMKLAKRYVNLFVDASKSNIVSMKNSFHGRTIATVSATGQTKYHEGFAPLFQGISYAAFNDIKDLEKVLDDKTAILMIEPIQGEGGIRPAEKAFLQKARQLCDEKDIVLIFDEVQCGIGRTGKVFAYENYDVKPDIVSLAKGLGAGFAVGAIIANHKVAKGFVPGTHASTFGGNQIATTAAKVVLETLKEGTLLAEVNAMSAYLTEGLLTLQETYSKVVDVRGMGLMMAIELSEPVGAIVMKAMDAGLLLINSGTHVIRFVPPLTITKEDIDMMLKTLHEILQEF